MGIFSKSPERGNKYAAHLASVVRSRYPSEQDRMSTPLSSELPGRESFHQRAIYVHQVRGDFASYAIDFGKATGYVIALRVGTDRARGAIVTSYALDPPWPGHEIQWGYHPDDLLSWCFVPDYSKLFESNLPGVLDQRRLLSRGRPVEGLLCGFAWDPIPAAKLGSGFAMAEIALVEDSGRRARSVVQLKILSSEFNTDVRERIRDRHRFFDDYDEIAEEDVV